MLTTPRRARTAAPLLLVALVAALGWGAFSPGTPEAHAGEARQHWGRTTVSVHDETGFADYRRAITLAAERWNAAGADVRLVVSGGRGAGCDTPAPGEILVCRHTFSGSRVGEARVWSSGEHVVRASVLLDTRSRPFEQLVAIACHELGHALGRGHRTEASSCMTAVVHSSFPDARDHAELRADHDHDHDAGTTAADPDAEAPTTCGLGVVPCLGNLLPTIHH